MENSVIRALRIAINQDPESLDLREHLAEVLFRNEDWDGVLEQTSEILLRQPDHLTALGYSQAAQEAREREGDGIAAPKLADSSRTMSRSGETVRLNDVAGMNDVKRKLRLSLFNYIENPHLGRVFRPKLAGGLLLYGPPGCGKSYLARAIAGEAGATFISVKIAEVMNLFWGESEKRLADMFSQARLAAPSVLFFDEMDALGRKRSARHSSAGRELVSALLAETDGVDATNSGVFLMGATNHPWDVDIALRRPGRFARTLFIPPPDDEARRTIIKLSMKARPVADLDVDWLSDKTKGWSGADIVHLCDTASELALEASLGAGNPKPIDMALMRNALQSTKSSVRPWFDVARNYALFGNAAGDWDELRSFLSSERML